MGEAPPSRERHGPAWLVHTIIMEYEWEREGDRLGHGTREVVVGREVGSVVQRCLF